MEAQRGTKSGKRSKSIQYDSNEAVRAALLELVIYLFFLVVTTIVALSSRHLYMFYFNQTIHSLFLSPDLKTEHKEALRYNQLVTTGDWWNFLQYTVMPDLHGKKEEAPAAGEAEAEVDAEAENTKNDYERKLLRENILLGPPRLRQIRVLHDSCHVHHTFVKYFDTCYGEYARSIEDMRAEYKGSKFYTLSELNAVPIWGTVGEYVGGGYVKDLTYKREENEKILSELKAENWIDRATRIVLFEFTLFNANTDLFDSIKFIAEVPPTGGIITSSHLQSLKLNSIWTDGNYFVMVIAIFYYGLVIYYTREEVLDFLHIGCINYVRSMWNVADLIIIVISYISLVYNIWHPIYLRSLLQRVNEEPDKFHSLDVICFWNIIYIDMMAICTFIVWIKVFKYISFNKTMLQFSNTFKRCAKDLFGFGVMFAIVFLAFSQLGLLLFGMKHPNFRNFQQSFLTLMRMVLGDCDYTSIEAADRIMGPIFFLSFTILVFFILLNMFLAIINETYSAVKNEIQHGRNHLQSFVISHAKQFYDRIRERANHLKRKAGRRPIEEYETKAPITNTDNAIDISPEKTSESSLYPRTSSTTGQRTQPIRVRESDIFTDYFEEIQIEHETDSVRRLTNRVVLMEDVLEQLITNMDHILNKVNTKKRAKK